MEINKALEKLSVTINNYERLSDSKDALETVKAFVKEAQTNKQIPREEIAKRLMSHSRDGGLGEVIINAGAFYEITKQLSQHQKLHTNHHLDAKETLCQTAIVRYGRETENSKKY